MLSNEKKVWTRVSYISFLVGFACFIVSFLQYFVDRRYELTFLRKYDSLLTNLVAFGGFFYLLFKPVSFTGYALVFYFYGIGNFLDDGNVIASLCITLSFLFLHRSGFMKKKKVLKTCLLLIIPMWALILQYFRHNLVFFLLAFMHIVGTVFILYLAYVLLYSKIKELEHINNTKILSKEKCTQQDIEYLKRVRDGEKYGKIAQLYNISESKIKSRMVELYELLDVKTRSEFLLLYHNYEFQISEE